jgi:hypothetical protein
MPHILGSRDVFEVRDAIVKLVQIFVINLHPAWACAQKGFGYQTVHPKIPLPPVN